MRKRAWRTDEIGYLIACYDRDGSSRVAADLGRSADSVTSQAFRLRLRSSQPHRRQAEAQARNNRSVDIGFFDAAHPENAFVLDFIRRWGRVRTSPACVLRLRCPASRKADLLAVRTLLRSRHRLQRSGRSLVLEICGRALVESFLSRYGRASARPANGNGPVSASQPVHREAVIRPARAPEGVESAGNRARPLPGRLLAP